MKLVTVQQMRALEQAADAQGLSYAVMMENAGQAVADWLEKSGVPGRRILVLVGPGNNGGDGLVAAHYLQQAGALVCIYVWKRDVANDGNWQRIQKDGIQVLWSHEDQRYTGLRRAVTQADYVLDALLGTGVSKPIAGPLQEILAAVDKALAQKRKGARVVRFEHLRRPPVQPRAHLPQVIAVDVPSGLNCDTGAVDPATPTADVTLTFGFPKVGQFLFPGASKVGELVVADIGIPGKLAQGVSLEVSTPDILRGVLPRRPLDAHKGTFGKLMVVAGSVNYTGAPYLAAMAAMRAGAGLVTLAIAELLHPALAAKLSEATFLLLRHQMGALVPEAVPLLRQRLDGYEALLLGPGLGRDPLTAEFVMRLLNLPASESHARLGFVSATARPQGVQNRLPPVVIDADALNALADAQGWESAFPVSGTTGLRQAPVVLTPHPGEMARLCHISAADVNADRIGVARRSAQQWGVVVVLKGAYTVIAAPDGRARVNPFATPALATAGTGDVLAGVIASLLAQGLEAFEAATAGAYLHGLAGQMLAEEIGPAGAVAGDLLDRLPLCLRRLSGG